MASSDGRKFVADNYSKNFQNSEIDSSSMMGPGEERGGLGNIFQILNQVNKERSNLFEKEK
jgi:hypothetical protein